MIRKALALALVWLQLAAPAVATTYYYNPSTGSDSNDGLAPTSSGGHGPRLTISNANGRPSGSEIVLAAGDYGMTAISPTGSNTTWRAADTSAAARRSTRVGGISIIRTSGSEDSHGTTINGLYVNGGVEVRQAGQYGNVAGFHIRNCTVESDFYLFDFQSARVEACSLGTGKYGSHFRALTANPIRSTLWAFNNTMYLYPSGPTGETGLFLYAESADHRELADQNFCMDNDLFLGNKVTLTLPAVTDMAKMTFIHGTRYRTSANNKWTLRDSTGWQVGSPAITQGYLMRDSLAFCVSDHDTVIIHTLIPGKGGLYAQLSGSGSVEGGHDNVWRNGYYQSDCTQPGYGSQYFYNLGPRDSVYLNTFVDSTLGTGDGLVINNTNGESYVERNTIMNLGGGGAVKINTNAGNCTGCGGANCWTGTLHFNGNILYDRSTASGATDYAAAIFWQSGGAGIQSDHNLYAHYNGNGSRSILGGICGSGGILFDVGPQKSLCNTVGNECNSLYGSPQFADSTFAHFNPALLSGSAAIGGFLGANIGAWDGTPGGGDLTPPARVTDLAVTGVSSNQAMVTFTAPGNDGATGTASSYEVRYSTAPPTEATFSSGTLVADLAAPQAAGSREFFVVPGLSANTTYYVAVRTTDGAANISLISNIVGLTTLTESGKDRFSPD